MYVCVHTYTQWIDIIVSMTYYIHKSFESSVLKWLRTAISLSSSICQVQASKSVSPQVPLKIACPLLDTSNPYVHACVRAKSLQSCLTLYDTMDCSLRGSYVHGIFQARILEWVAIFSSRWSSGPRDRTCVSCGSCITGFTAEPLGKPCTVPGTHKLELTLEHSNSNI